MPKDIYGEEVKVGDYVIGLVKIGKVSFRPVLGKVTRVSSRCLWCDWVLPDGVKPYESVAIIHGEKTMKVTDLKPDVFFFTKCVLDA